MNNTTSNAANNAAVLVNANGANNFPSAPSIIKIGKKLINVVETDVTIAEETSVVARKTTDVIDSSGERSLTNCRMFSNSTIPKSTMVPMAIAIPDSATILASTRVYFIAMNTIRTATGNRAETNKAARMFPIITIITSTTTNNSSKSASSKVPRVSLIKMLRS